ncbi:MAG: Tm-1-like ATP-binding domain-containing protein [Deltaproteobacteria bacterium]|nr:Tm-1-like ATP-binding domain-containing protein [Deltaproteobacteria bacterium]MBW2344953.1 Tm-1-like ATP-binding domain-containing protein [Deltaproteobacteria bacterium]
MEKSILIISTLDTKEEEATYLRERILALGLKPLLMDIAMRGNGSSKADITPAQVATAGDSSLKDIHKSSDREQITKIMLRGAKRLEIKLFEDGKIDGVISIGGSTGSLMATEIMHSLPFGVPKVMVSCTASIPGLSTRYIKTSDMVLFHSVIEIFGLNDILRNVLERAALALAGMVQGTVTPPKSSKGKSIAMTMLGPCEQCATAVRLGLEEKGFQVIGLTATGVGDRAMEEMIAQGFFQGVIDITPGGVGEHLFGFMRDAGPHRLESAGKIGIPQIISTCSVNHMTPSKSKYKPEYHERRKYNLDRFRTWLRLSPDELIQVADVFAEKVNRSKGPVKFVIPLKGWSSVDIPGNPTYDPKEDRIFTEELRRRLKPEIESIEVNANLEDPEFAKAIVKAALEVL